MNEIDVEGYNVRLHPDHFGTEAREIKAKVIQIILLQNKPIFNARTPGGEFLRPRFFGEK
jgi:hypothetical protein